MGCCVVDGGGQIVIAALNGDSEAVKAQLDKELLKSIKSRAWHAAAEAGKVDVLKLLVEAVEQGDSQGMFTSSVKRSLNSNSMRGKSDLPLQVILTRTNKNGMSPLAVACHHGREEAVKYLLSLGSDCWQPDAYGYSPLHLAVRGNHMTIIREIFTTELPPPSPLALRVMSPNVKYINCVDVYGWTSLHYAVYDANEACTIALLSQSANLIARTLICHDKYPTMPPGVTALHVAAVQGNQAMITLLLRSYYENSADLLPSHANSMVETNERHRRANTHPDPRLILTRTGRLPYHLALRFGHTQVLEWLDPSIPLMFLLSGSDEPSSAQAGEGRGGLVNVVGVPRLTVLAASALHLALMNDLRRVEKEIDMDDKQKEEMAVRIEAEKKLLKEEKKLRKKKKKKSKGAGSKSLRNLLGLKDQGDGRGYNDTMSSDTSTGEGEVLTEDQQRERAEKLLIIAEDERKQRQKKSNKKKKKTLGQSLRNPPSALNGPSNNTSRGVSLMQILTPGFARRSEYNTHDNLMGVQLPADAGQDDSAVATLRGAEHPLARPFAAHLNATLTTGRTDSGRVIGILGERERRKSDPSGSFISHHHPALGMDESNFLSALPGASSRFKRSSLENSSSRPSRLSNGVGGAPSALKETVSTEETSPGTHFLTTGCEPDEQAVHLPGSIMTPEPSKNVADSQRIDPAPVPFPILDGETILSHNSLGATRSVPKSQSLQKPPSPSEPYLLHSVDRRSNSTSNAADQMLEQGDAMEETDATTRKETNSKSKKSVEGGSPPEKQSFLQSLLPFLSPSKPKTAPASLPRRRRRYDSDSGTASGPLTSPSKVSPQRPLGTLAEDGEDYLGDEDSEEDEEEDALTSTEPSKAKMLVDDDDDACPVCLDAPTTVSLIKCDHKLCLDCSRDLCTRHKLSPALCPYCRTLISGFKRTGSE